MHRRAPRVAACAVLASITLASVARAEPTGDQRARATALFQDARARMAAGDYAGACPMLQESQRLDAGLGTLLNLAMCHVGEGRTATAWAELHEVLALAERAGQADRVLYAQQRIDELAPRLSTLVIVVTSPPAGLEVTLDATAVGRATWGNAVPVDPGAHRIAAAAPGHAPWEQLVQVLDHAHRVRVEVPALRQEPASAPPQTAPSAPSPAPQPVVAPVTRAAPAPIAGDLPGSVSPSAVAGWALVGLGAVGIGIGIGAGITAFERDAESDALCEPECDEAGFAFHQDAGTAADVSTVSFVVGGAALAVGAALLVEGVVRDRSVRARRDGVSIAF